MGSSTFEQPAPAEVLEHAATGHLWHGNEVPGRWRVYPEMAAAGLWTTAADLGRLLAAIASALRGDTDRLGLDAQSLTAMFEPQLPDMGPGMPYTGLGWFCTGTGTGFRCSHTGGNEGFVSELVLLPACGHGAVVMINANQGAPMTGEIVDALARELGWPDQSAPGGGQAPADPATYAGRYRDAHGRELTIALSGEGLSLELDRQPPLTLTGSGGAFRAGGVNLTAHFEAGGEGAPRTLQLIQGGSAFRFVRHSSDKSFLPPPGEE